VRAVAYLPDGNSSEDLVFVNAPDIGEEVKIDFVELYATAVDRRGKPVDDLKREEIAVSEEARRRTCGGSSACRICRSTSASCSTSRPR
jgi:hypothetical protein